MKIKYHILWIDDEPLIPDMERVSRHLKDLGFIPEIKKLESTDTLNDSFDFRKFNLILLDYQLNNSKTTDLIMKKIKQKDYYSEVIFYSSREKFAEHIKQNLPTFEGVFWCEDRGNVLFQKILKVINLTLKKFQDLNNLRGLVMAETSDLDKLKKQIFLEYFKLNHAKKDEFEKEIYSKLEEAAVADLKKVKKHKGKKITINEEDIVGGTRGDIVALMDSRIFELSKKGRIIKKLIEYISSNSQFDFDDYNIKIIKKRNKLAHEPEREENGVIYFGDLTFTAEECKNIRKDIQRYKDLLDALLIEVKRLEAT